MPKRILGALSIAVAVTVIALLVGGRVWERPQFREDAWLAAPLLLLVVGMLVYGWRWLMDLGPGLETLQVDPHAPELVESIREARRTLPGFLDRVRRHEDGAYIKFPLVTNSGVTEHIWAYVHHYDRGVFNVSLANSPYTTNEEIAVRRDVRESEVEDWQIMRPDGRIEGGFSIRALFRHLEDNGIHINRTMRKQRAQLLGDSGVEDELP